MADLRMTLASARPPVASFQSMSEGSVGSDTSSRNSSIRPLLFNAHAQAIRNLPDKKPDPSTVPPNSVKYEEMVHLARMYDVTKEKIKAHTANHLPVGELKDLLNFILYQNEKLLQADREPTDKGPFANHYAEVKRTHNDLLSRIEFDMTYYKTGCAKEGWNMAAGFMAFFLCFGTGTLMSTAYRQPWLTMVITPTVWSLMERMAPMIRATSWRNPHADETIPKFMKLQERRARDWVRSWRPNLAKRQKTYPWTDPKTRESTNLTAAQYRKKIAIFSAWTGKVWTDDVVYLWYTFMYGSRVSLLYRYATPAFLATPQGFALSMFAMFAAGGTAGAATMFSMQQCRRLAYRHAQGDFKGGEVLTRSRDIWTAASIATQKDSELVEAKVQARFKQAHEGNALKEYLRCLKDEEIRAQSKSSILSSIIYELSPLVQTRRRRDDTKGEVAGKRIEAVSGFIAKNIALLPFFLFAQLVTQPYVNRNEQVPEHLMWVQYLLLIVGFSFRKELEIVGRVLSGLTFGLKDVINDYRGLPDGEETGDVVTEMPREHFGDRSNGPGEGGDPHDEDVMAPYRPQNLAGGQSDDESGDGTLSQAVSLNSPASSPDSLGNGSNSRRTRGSRVGDFLSPYAPRPGKKIADDNDNDRDSPLLPNTRGRYRSNRSRASDETPVNTVSAAEKQRPEGRDDGQADDVVFDMRYLTSDKEGQPDSSDASSSGSSRHRKSKKRTRTATRQTTRTGRSGASFERKPQRKNMLTDMSGRSGTSRSSESPSSKTDSDSSATRSYPTRSHSGEESDTSD